AGSQESTVQASPSSQAAPQAPQWAGSVRRSTQAPPQQAPPGQAVPSAAGAAPHAPPRQAAARHGPGAGPAGARAHRHTPGAGARAVGGRVAPADAAAGGVLGAELGAAVGVFPTEVARHPAGGGGGGTPPDQPEDRGGKSGDEPAPGAGSGERAGDGVEAVP